MNWNESKLKELGELENNVIMFAANCYVCETVHVA